MVAFSPVLLIYFSIICRWVSQPIHGAVYSLLTQMACPVLFEVCPLMARVRTMLLIRKSRKLVAKHASERQYASIDVTFPLILRPCRNANVSLDDAVLGGLY